MWFLFFSELLVTKLLRGQMPFHRDPFSYNMHYVFNTICNLETLDTFEMISVSALLKTVTICTKKKENKWKTGWQQQW